MLESLALSLALSLDAFAASLAYGMDDIRIPRLSAVLVSAICSGLLAVSLLAGGWLAGFLPPGLGRALAVGVMLALGIVKLFDSAVKSLIARLDGRGLCLRVRHVKLILSVYADPVRADADRSRVISPREAVTLALAMSLDGLTIGFGAGLGRMNPWLALALSFAVTLCAIGAGTALGRRMPRRRGRDPGWVSGLVLIALGLAKLA